MAIETGIDLVWHFEETARQAAKIFVPDILDEKIAANIVTFCKTREDEKTEPNILYNCVIRYMKSHVGLIVNIKEFANAFPTLYINEKENVEHLQRVQVLLKKTEKRMKDVT